MCWTGVVESSDSMLPTTGLVGGCGIGLSLLVDAIAAISLPLNRHCERKRSNPLRHGKRMDCFVACAPRNDGPLNYPNLRLRHSISFALTSSGFSCWVQ